MTWEGHHNWWVGRDREVSKHFPRKTWKEIEGEIWREISEDSDKITRKYKPIARLCLDGSNLRNTQRNFLLCNQSNVR